MLIQFTVENYKSFNEPATLSMNASRIKEHPAHVIGGKVPTLRGAAIYGKNAAGKSNLILAMGFARDLVVRGTAQGRGIATEPFALRADGDRVSSFRWFFRYQGKIWQYGYSVAARGVVDEYLYARDEERGAEKKWFTRETVDGEVKVTFGDALRGPARGELAKRLKLIASNIRKRPEQLFLSFAIENSVEELAMPYEWFDKVLKLLHAEGKAFKSMEHTFDDKFLGFLSDFLKFADTGIQKIERVSSKIDWDHFSLRGITLSDRANMEAKVERLKENHYILFPEVSVAGGAVLPLFFARVKGELRELQLHAVHLDNKGQKVHFPLEWESEGTQRLIQLAPMLYGHKNEPMVLVIDELDRRLHTHLTRKFVELALDSPPESQNQLIFTTHDTNLLTNELLRRDEIWMTDKVNGATTLTSLVEYDIRNDLNYEDAYHEGRFDGVPRFRGEKQLVAQLEAAN